MGTPGLLAHQSEQVRRPEASQESPTSSSLVRCRARDRSWVEVQGQLAVSIVSFSSRKWPSVDSRLPRSSSMACPVPKFWSMIFFNVSASRSSLSTYTSTQDVCMLCCAYIMQQQPSRSQGDTGNRQESSIVSAARVQWPPEDTATSNRSPTS